MFTGLIQRIGKVARVARHGEGARLAFEFAPWDEDVVFGESIAVNGVCLTVASCNSLKTSPSLAKGCPKWQCHEGGVVEFEADVLDETLDCTTLGSLKQGSRVNLERALRMSDRLGGHFVSGHIDAMGTVSDIRQRGRDIVLRIRCEKDTLRAIVYKGSIAIDGVSLTVSAVDGTEFEVNLIPTTLTETTLGDRRIGDRVNIETDLLGKYALQAMERFASKDITLETLAKAGFGE